MIDIFEKQIFKDAKVSLDLSNYATTADLKNAIGADTSDFPIKTD